MKRHTSPKLQIIPSSYHDSNGIHPPNFKSYRRRVTIRTACIPQTSNHTVIVSRFQRHTTPKLQIIPSSCHDSNGIQPPNFKSYRRRVTIRTAYIPQTSNHTVVVSRFERHKSPKLQIIPSSHHQSNGIQPPNFKSYRRCVTIRTA